MKRKEFNSAKYTTRADDKSTDWEAAFRTKIALRMIGSGKKVLDIGCYDGYITAKIRAMGNDVTGCELSRVAVRLCRQRGLKCIEHDLEERFPFPSRSFDVIFAGEIIEHIYDTDGLLQECRRLLRPGGSLVLTTPNIAALTRRLKLLWGANPLIDIGLISPDGKEKSAGHIRYFTIKSLEQLLHRNGFRISTWRTDFISVHKLRFVLLGSIFPRLGWGLIVKARPYK